MLPLKLHSSRHNYAQALANITCIHIRSREYQTRFESTNFLFYDEVRLHTSNSFKVISVKLAVSNVGSIVISNVTDHVCIYKEMIIYTRGYKISFAGRRKNEASARATHVTRRFYNKVLLLHFVKYGLYSDCTVIYHPYVRCSSYHPSDHNT
jgi:hypothetical protein